jgi:polar amino acid transport system substrate-binding protein/glutamate/aspartate transport system substrate-binding protein
MHPRLHRIFLIAAAATVFAGSAAAAGVLDRLKETGEIRLGVRKDAAPLSYIDDDGRPAGYSVLICNAVAAQLGKDVGRDDLETTYVTIGTDDRFDAVVDGRVDLLCGADTITLGRREQVDFSIPTFVDGAAVLLRKGSDPSFDALAGKRIGVRAGTTTEEVLRATLAAKQMKADVLAFNTHPEGLAALENEQVDAYFGDQSILFHLYFQSPKRESLAISDNTLTVEVQGLALPRGDSDFRLAVDRALSELYRSGEMMRFFEEALPGATPGIALKSMFLLSPELP